METKENKKTSRIIQGIDIFCIVVQVIVAIVLGVKLISMGILPTAYVVIYLVVIALLNVGVAFASRRKTTGIILAILSVLLTAVLIYAYLAVSKVDNTLQKVSHDTKTETVQMSVLVLKDDTAQTLSDLSKENIGYVKEDEYAQDVKAEIDKAVSEDVFYNQYDDATLLADGLLLGKERAIIMNHAYIDMVAEQDDYADFANKVKELYTLDVEVKVPDNTGSQDDQKVYELSSDEDTFVMYISGIDTFGSVNVKSRSDVNILALVNTKTGHVQLINTPRDYFVSLVDKGGAMDKLTHAGLYGVDCSKAAIENLYGVKIDYYLRMNFSGFEGIIDTLGGIDVYSENDFTVEPIKHYTVGYNHLSGIEALAFARERHSFAAGDVQRGKNQMEVVKAMINKMASSDMLANYSQVMDELSDCFQTDMPADVIYDLVRYQLTSGTKWKIDSYTVAGKGASKKTYSMPRTTCYVMIPNDSDVAQAKQLIESILAEE